MGDRLVLARLLLAVVIGGAGQLADSLAGEPEVNGAVSGDDAVFPMREISIFDVDQPLLGDFTRGARAGSQEGPYDEVKVYPTLRSKKPIYGLLWLAPEPLQRESGTPLYFVVDESGETVINEEPAKDAPEEKKESSILDTLSAALGINKPKRPGEEEQPKLNNTYDRLYVDLNGDLDLTNDPVATPTKKTPADLIRRFDGLRQAVVFDEISVPLDFGEPLGDRPVRLLPRLEVQEYQGKEYSGVSFLSAVARKGSVKLGGQRYEAYLAQRYSITGRYDRKSTGLLLTSPKDPNGQGDWWGADQLDAMRLIDGKYFTTSTTPLGDKLIVKPYGGELGILRIGPGGRDLDKISIRGSVRTEYTGLALGEMESGQSDSPSPMTECRLPTGDYIPVYVSINYGDLQFSMSENYHSDGKKMALDAKSWVYGIKIRKGKPFVWDFSTPPEVMFASPAKDQTYKLGDEVEVHAVLIDPKLTIMFRGLTDTSRKEDKTVETADGRTTTYKKSVSLDPSVTITNAAGKQVAEGPMPFG